MILAWIFGETELIIQVPSILSTRIQAWMVEEESTIGEDKVREPSMKPSLFLAMRDFLTIEPKQDSFLHQLEVEK